jgi:hypothetical protein
VRETVTGKYRKLHNEKHDNLYYTKCYWGNLIKGDDPDGFCRRQWGNKKRIYNFSRNM